MQMCENDDRNLGMVSNWHEIKQDIQSRPARRVDFKYHAINVTGLIDPQPRLSIGGFKYLIVGRTDRESMGVVLSIFVIAIDQRIESLPLNIDAIFSLVTLDVVVPNPLGPYSDLQWCFVRDNGCIVGQRRFDSSSASTASAFRNAG